MTAELLSKLGRLYKNTGTKPDIFGRRPALPSEVELVLKPKPQPPVEEQPDWRKKKKPDERPSCDKGGHKERSRHNDNGEHDDHWGKAERDFYGW